MKLVQSNAANKRDFDTDLFLIDCNYKKLKQQTELSFEMWCLICTTAFLLGLGLGGLI